MRSNLIRYVQRRLTAPSLTRNIVFLLLVSGCFVSNQLCADDNLNAQHAKRHTISEGVEFGLWGEMTSKPAPTLFILASTIEETLDSPYFRQCGNQLGKQGYLLVSIDLPCHGKEHRSGEPEGLAGWPYRCEQGNNFVDDNNSRLSVVLDHLIKSGQTDASKVAVCGTSRGGYLALQFAAHDPRVKAVAAFAPVTDLTALREFKGQETNRLVKSLSVIHQSDKLAGRPVWIVIGDQDKRVGTDHSIDLARAITKSSLANGCKSQVDLHVIAEPRGHTVPSGSPQLAADWFRRQIKIK